MNRSKDYKDMTIYELTKELYDEVRSTDMDLCRINNIIKAIDHWRQLEPRN